MIRLNFQPLYCLLLTLICFEASRVAALQSEERGGFRCSKNGTTIDLEKFCDGVEDCMDKSDENVSPIRYDSLDEWQSCSNARNNHISSCLVERALICREEVVCRNVTPCDLGCKTHYRCQGSNTCVGRSTICDGNPCNGCSEDHGWDNGVGFKCTKIGRKCLLPQQLLHDNVTDCDGGDDLCFDFELTSNSSKIRTAKIMRPQCFECLSGTMLIPRVRVCDGVIDCPDLSDECLCEGRKPEICNQVVKFKTGIRSSTDMQASREVQYEVTGPSNENSTSLSSSLGVSACGTGLIQCQSGRCIPRKSVCDGIKNCEEDEKYDYCQGTIICGNATRYERKCRCEVDYKKCITKFGIACDGRADCDSLPIPGKKYKLFPEDECSASCPISANGFFCFRTTSGSVLPMFKCRAKRLPTPFDNVSTGNQSSSPRSRSYRQGIGRATYAPSKCDGIVDCPERDDEVNCTNRFSCSAIKPRYISISVSKTCDGFIDCRDGSDETAELCRDRRFMCSALGKTMVSIDKNLVCDWTQNCDDGSDEFEERTCNDGRFYCENKKPLYIKETQVFDGRQDCTDWSDECPTKNVSAFRNAFSSRYEMIKHTPLRICVWIMAILSLVGNGAVLFLEMKTLKKEKRSSVAVANRMLVINLAVSDILMGVYLCGIGVAGLTMRGRYCTVDMIWRSSTHCTVLGLLSVVSSESSVLTMLMLTSCRLLAVVRPFQSSTRSHKRLVFSGIVLSWMLSITLAIIPTLAPLSTTFVAGVEFRRNQFFKNAEATLNETRKMFKDLMTYDLKPNVTVPNDFNVDFLTWREIEESGKVLFSHEHFKIEKMFGYYSKDSVCIGKFFITSSDSAWGFSLAINLINFFSFLYVAAAYAVIYTQYQKSAVLRANVSRSNDKATAALQRKILRLVVTDFCCWMPICIIAFVKLAGAYVSDTAYVFTAIILLPINSALNPIFYSVLLDFLYEKIKCCCKRTKKLDIGTVSILSHETDKHQSIEMVSTSPKSA